MTNHEWYVLFMNVGDSFNKSHSQFMSGINKFFKHDPALLIPFFVLFCPIFFSQMAILLMPGGDSSG